MFYGYTLWLDTLQNRSRTSIPLPFAKRQEAHQGQASPLTS